MRSPDGEPARGCVPSAAGSAARRRDAGDPLAIVQSRQRRRRSPRRRNPLGVAGIAVGYGGVASPAPDAQRHRIASRDWSPDRQAPHAQPPWLPVRASNISSAKPQAAPLPLIPVPGHWSARRQEEQSVSQRTLTIIKPDSARAGKAGAILAHLEKKAFACWPAGRSRSPRRRRAPSMPSTRSGLSTRTGPVHDRGSGVGRRSRAGRRRRAASGRHGGDRFEEGGAGTIRNLYGTDIERNAIHGSDSPENAAREIGFFFPEQS